MDSYLQLVPIIISTVSLGLALWAVIFKRKEIFKNKLTEIQLAELLEMREQIKTNMFDTFYIKAWADNISAINSSLETFKKEQPEDYKRAKRLQSDFTELVSFSDIDTFHLLPKRFDKNRMLDLAKYLKDNIQPYSIFTFSQLTSDDIKLLQDKLYKYLKYIDGVIEDLAG